MQALSCALSGRDIIGVAYTGSGKTLVFALPSVMVALEEEVRRPIVGKEGPFCLLICPSRELARQTYEIVTEFTAALAEDGYPALRTLLCIGGIQTDAATPRVRGVHIVVGTPGRTAENLRRSVYGLEFCRMLCLDEADRLLDFTYEEDLHKIISFFDHQRQTLLFSATMPEKVQQFAKESLVRPVLINTGRAGAASMDVIQEVELVKEEAKLPYLVECLQKTAPPVLIFCQHKQTVDAVNVHLLEKGVHSVCIHGGMEQKDREEAIRLFKSGAKEVLVATDIASKGLDFPDIQHVINYDMVCTLLFIFIT